MAEVPEVSRLVEVIGATWTPESKRRGEEYYRAGRVALDRVEPRIARATVRGEGGVYTTVYEREAGSSWTAECSCPAARSVGHCKHLWAFAVALDHEGWRFENVVEGSLREARLVRVSSWRARLADLRKRTAPQRPEGASERQTQLLYVLRPELGFTDDKFIVEVQRRHVLKSGAWSKPQQLGALSQALVRDLDEHDRRIAAFLRGANESAYYFAARFQLDAAQAEMFLPLMAMRGALCSTRASGERTAPLEYDANERWTLQRSLREDETTGEFVIEGMWRAGERSEPLSNVIATLARRFLVFERRLGQLANPSDLAWAELFLLHGAMRVPAADKAELARELAAMQDDLALHGSLVTIRRDVAPVGLLTLAAPRWNAGEWGAVTGAIAFDYAGQRVDAANATKLVTSAEPWIERDLERELSLTQRPLALGATSAGPGALAVPLERVGELVRTLAAEGWRIDGEGARYRVGGSMRWSLASGLDWFDLKGTVDFEGASAELPKLLAAIRRGERTVKLGDGSVGVLPEDWMERHGALLSLGTTRGELVRFKSSQAWLVDTLLADQSGARVDQAFRDSVARLASFRGVAPVHEPRGFRGELRPYQRDGLGWLEFLEAQRLGGCLADDMGLGKTVQVLAWLLARRARQTERAPTLVVAPRSLTHNWLSEAHRFAPELTTLDYTGLGRRPLLDKFERTDLVVTTYGTVRNDIERLGLERFDCVVLDESQAIKNANSLTAKAVRVLQAEHRLALSGTPIENHLGELWSLFEFLNPGMLGRSSVFSELVSSRRDSALEGDARKLLAQAVRPFVLRRTKEQVLRDLPQLTEQMLECELDETQRRDYDELRVHYQKTLLAGSAGRELDSFSVLEALLRLRQAACHPGLIDARRANESSAKFDALLAMLDEVVDAGHKALVFSQFTSFLALLRPRLAERGWHYAYLDGGTPANERTREIERFQSEAACPLFLLSLKAGGVGLNLTAADYVFLLDPWWNPAVEAQAIGRAHRIGQERSVFAYKLVAADTIEQRVLELQAKKRELAAVILDGEAATLRDLTREDLERLLR